jgi:predicted permease
MRLGPTARQRTPEEGFAFSREASATLAAVPGVSSRGGVNVLPFTSSIGWGGVNVEGWTPKPGEELQVDQRGATPDYFKAMQIPVVQGRAFTDLDLVPNAERVALIDQKFARRFWPNGDAVGKHLWNDPAQKFAIVGVVGSVKQYGLDIDGRIVVYRPTRLGSYQVARTSGDPAMVGRAMVQKIHDLDPTITVSDVQTMTDRMSDSLARQRFEAVMLGAFAVFALVLAIVGVYGVMSYLVTQGAHDIGVRMALGAERSQILGMVLRRALELTAAGIVVGLAGAFGLTRLLESLLFGVSTRDALTFAGVPVVLIVTAMIASYLPALRATRVDPVVALRDE